VGGGAAQLSDLAVDVVGRVGVLTLDRPHARNALSRSLLEALPGAVRALDDDDAVDVIVLTGRDPAFCAGLDLKELGSAGEGQALLRAGDMGADTLSALPPVSKPVIGAVNGAAVTGGLELALACDFLVASEQARFADTHARVGVLPAWGLTVLLPQAVGLRRAREMSYSGRFVDARTALEWGLVNHVVPHDRLLPFCLELAADIATSDRRGVRTMRRTYADGSLRTAGEAWALERDVAAAWLDDEGGVPGDMEARQAELRRRSRDAR